MNTSERILQLEKELTELKAQERREKEEARKKEIEERDRELKVILDAIVVFNDKHNTDYYLVELPCVDLPNWSFNILG